jgi:putative transposase
LKPKPRALPRSVGRRLGRHGRGASDGGGYVALNPVRAKLVKRTEDGRGSSVRAHLSRQDDGVVATAPILECCGGDFAARIASETAPALIAALRASETTGRPLGSPSFLDRFAWLGSAARCEIASDPR